MAREGSALDNIIVKPVYLRAVNAIVQPEVQIPCSAYFFRNWLPRLGTLRWSMVLTLRSICSQRQPDGTNRGEICRSDLAALLGVHEATISRILNSSPSSIHRGWRVLDPSKESDAQASYLAKFIPRLRYKYERDVEAAVTRRVGYVIDVVMDDPLIPEDEERLAVTIAEQLLQASVSPSKELTDVSAWVDESVENETGSGSRKGKAGLRKPSAGSPSKTQNTISYSSVKKQLATDTKSVEERIASSNGSVNRQKAAAKRVVEQDAPVLTLTNFNYKDIVIPLDLNRKRDLRAALKPLVEYTASSLDDEHSKGLYYLTLTQLYPDDLQVFVDALEAAQKQGKRRKSINMGAAFVKAIRESASSAGVSLEFGNAEGRVETPADPVEEEVAPSPRRKASTRSERDSFERKDSSFQKKDTSFEEKDTSFEKKASPSPKGSRYVAGTRLTTKQLWTSLLDELRSKTSKASYEMWLRNCSIARVESDTVVIATPSAFAREWVNDRLLSIIRRALKQVVGREMNVRCEALAPALAGRVKGE